MMALSTQSAPSSSSPSFTLSPSSYDVFLCFRGDDTRYGFVDHLHKAFQQRGFIVFKDDKKLEQGSTIAEKLFKAIEESQYAIVVISKTFAESKWCLNELIEILRCKRESGLKVLPIFYHVDPADARRQKGIFANAFAKHQEDPEVGGEKMRTWRAALKEVADMAGTHVSHNSPEATIVEQITTTIFCGLRLNPSQIFKDLFGIESRVEKLKFLLCLQMDDVRFLGIHGMGGIGKTTLARALYNCVRCEFDASSFVCCGKDQGSSIEKLQQQIFREILKENNREISNCWEGVEQLKQRLQNKKVFIVFDDVNPNQLKFFPRSPNCFGKGSRIVVTGRDSQLWNPPVSQIYEVDLLEHKDALLLFSWKAFNKLAPENGFARLSKRVITAVGCLPLALEVIGSMLHDKKVEVWESILNDLECFEDGVFSILQISYNGLTEMQKEMFLDIACLFVNVSKLEILPIFESLGYNPIVNFEVLKRKSLIKISTEGVIWMHDLLREMGRRIVNKVSEPGNRSRLWCSQEINHVFENNSGTSAIRAIVYNFFQGGELNYEAFSKMKKLKIFIMGSSIASIDLLSIRMMKTLLRNHITSVGSHSNLILSNELCVLKWNGFSLESLPESFQPNSLVKLSMQFSRIKVLWHGKKTLNGLKYIDLFGSEDLTELPDLSGAPNLEELKFGSCKSLKILHPSIGTLKKLLHLDLSRCESLERLPAEIYWELLVHLDLSSCTKLWNFPSNGHTVTPSWDPNLLGPNSDTYLCQIIDSHHSRNSCHNWLYSLTSLKRLDLSDCRLLDGEFLSGVSFLSSLQHLYLDGNCFRKIPDRLYLLSQLETLHISSGGSELLFKNQALPKLPLSLSDFKISCQLYMRDIPEMILKACPRFSGPPVWPTAPPHRFLKNGSASVWFSVATDGTPYKILQLNMGKSPFYSLDGGNMLAWGPTLGCEVPDWFNQKSTNFFRADMDFAVGIALFVVYQVGEHGTSNCSTSRGSNPTSFEFTCQFQELEPIGHPASPESTCLHLVFRVPEVPLLGLNGFWALVPSEVFYTYLRRRGRCYSYKTSIKTSWNGEATEWKSRLVHERDVSEFFDVLNNISPQGLTLKNLEDFSFQVIW